jgi:ribonuclease P protein component
VLRQGKRHVGRLLVVYVSRSDGPAGVGFVVGRNVGGAVRRNRARRLMKEAWRHMMERASPGIQVVFAARPEIEGAGLRAVASEMERALAKAGVLWP